MEAVVALPIAVVAGVAWHGGRLRAGSPFRWREVLAWVTLAGLLAAVEAEAYLSAPRSAHPTLSSIADSLMASHPERAFLFVSWIALGAVLFGSDRARRAS